nr:TlpA disulfide reductase family protein [uncultured Pedobacter sp.]
MKKNIALFCLMFAAVQASAQFNLRGQIINYSGKEDLVVNTPLVYGFHKENSISIPIAKNGTFNITLPTKAQNFVSLIFQRQFYLLLITKNKTLTASINENDKKLELLSGTALSENKLLQKINIMENPVFMEEQARHFYEGLSFSELNTRLIQPYFAKRNEKINIVTTSKISLKNKKLITSEVKSVAYNYLNDFARTQLNNKSTIDSMIINIFDNSIIKPEVLPAGPQYYSFADNYLRYLETKAFLKIKKDSIKPTEPIPYYGISLDSANVVVKKYGKPYWRWVGSTKNFPEPVTEQYTYQQIINLYYDKDLRQIAALSDVFKKQFPLSSFNQEINQKVNSLKKMLAQNESNTDIVVLKDYNKIQSVYDVVGKYKGKVVYLDVWGTWCGPCKEELKFMPQLKSAFTNKDVIFLYLDMDEEDRDVIWKEFIKVNGLTGVHFRKNRQTIAPIWKELLADNQDKAEYYPQYFIFDKEGKIAVSKALRPSDKEALYQQINSVLAR